MPFAFAAHFSPKNTIPALELYRQSFRPSDVLKEPYAMVGVTVLLQIKQNGLNIWQPLIISGFKSHSQHTRKTEGACRQHGWSLESI